VLITATIKGFERRDVAIVDVPGSFLTADMDKEVTMCLRGRLAELMVKTAPNIYRKFISLDNEDNSILYVKLQKALYGCLRSALLFYLKLVKDLEMEGYELNPYDPCVANKIVAGTQFTVTWHVDDLKLSHVSSDKVTNTIEWLKSIYGQDMRVSRGKKHDYLGMDLDYSNEGEVKITMINYLKEAIVKSAAMPAADHLFTIRPEGECKPLGEPEAMAFHHSVVQLLFASTRARKDIHTTIACLTMRVRNPNEDDWGKLRRLMRYIKGTINLPLILRADNIHVIKWWVDASLATHDNCRGHTGGTMSLGKGLITGVSKKQKINTRSSTEAELVGADDMLPQIMWTRYFIEAQGFNVDESILYQDNLSAMLLEKNGKQSSSKRTKHIWVRYFFIRDRIVKKNGDMSLKHCPTGDMVGDHFTKPLQGAQFRKFRADIQRVPTNMSDLDMGLGQDEMTKVGPSPQECVEKPGKDPRANDSGSKRYGTVAQGAGARRARPVHLTLSEQTNDATPSGRPSEESTGAGGSLEQTKGGSALGKQAWGRKSYAEATKGKLPFQKP
jgi:hypothetical protein